jgi:hypothetical protein
LKHHLQVVKMYSEDIVVNYLMNIKEIENHLVAINVYVEDVELVNVALRDLPKY